MDWGKLFGMKYCIGSVKISWGLGRFGEYYIVGTIFVISISANFLC